MSWLKIKICGCRSARLGRPTLATNGLGLAEGVEIEALKLNLLLMLNRSTNVE